MQFERAPEDDRSLVVWGWRPDLYVLSGLTQGVRYPDSTFQIDARVYRQFFRELTFRISSIQGLQFLSMPSGIAATFTTITMTVQLRNTNDFPNWPSRRKRVRFRSGVRTPAGIRSTRSGADVPEVDLVNRLTSGGDCPSIPSQNGTACVPLVYFNESESGPSRFWNRRRLHSCDQHTKNSWIRVSSNMKP